MASCAVRPPPDRLAAAATLVNDLAAKAAAVTARARGTPAFALSAAAATALAGAGSDPALQRATPGQLAEAVVGLAGQLRQHLDSATAALAGGLRERPTVAVCTMSLPSVKWKRARQGQVGAWRKSQRGWEEHGMCLGVASAWSPLLHGPAQQCSAPQGTGRKLCNAFPSLAGRRRPSHLHGT